MNIEEALSFLGKRVKDVVTGFSGVVTSLSFDLYGCQQAIVTPEVKKEGGKEESGWYDICRLQVLSPTPVMAPPDFLIPKGPEAKPKFFKP